MENQLGLKEAIAMGIGGIIGGGIFAVLGIALEMAGNSALISYLIAGFIALASGYSYIKLTEFFKEQGGSFTFLENYFHNKNIAGVFGWILMAGYIGSIAMYAYAFGAFLANLLGFSTGSLVRPLLSILILTIFVIINIDSVKDSGYSEDILVYIKVAILFIFGILGCVAIFSNPNIQVFQGGLFNKGIFSPLVAIGIIFVSFQGFQVLTYEVSEMKNKLKTLKKAIYISIIVSVLIYLLIAFVVSNVLTPQQVLDNKEIALGIAGQQLFNNPITQKIIYWFITIAALFSTSSAINATMFGTARLGYKIATEEELPSLFSFRDKMGIPIKSLIAIGIISGIITLFRNLEIIATFASFTFIIIFGVVNYVCLKEHENNYKKIIPLFGLISSILVILSLIGYLLFTNIILFFIIIITITILILLEIIYSERNHTIEIYKRKKETYINK